MSPMSREGSRKREWPTRSGNREEFDGFSQLLVFALSGDGKLGYIAMSDYNPTNDPDSATPRASITPRPGDAGEEDENDGNGGDGNNSGNNNKKKKKGKKKQNLLGLVVDGEEAARLQKRVETEKAGVCYILVSSLPVNYRKLVQGLLCPYAMWQAIEGHFGTRNPTGYASSYTGVFRYRLEDPENPEMFVQTLDSNIITFERVIDTKLSGIFKSVIRQHALPTSWEYIVRGWLGQAKTLSYIKLLELVSSELKRRRPDGSGQDKGNGEKAYAAVEAKPVGAIVERKCFGCKKAGHLVYDCPENPNRGEKVNTSEPPKKKQNTGKQYNKKDTKRTDHRDRDHKGYEDRHRGDRRSPPCGHTSGQWTSGHSGAHEDDRGRQGYGGHGDQRGPPASYRPRSPHYGCEPRGFGYGGSMPPYFNQSRGPGFHTSPPRDEWHYGYQSPRIGDRGYQPQPCAGPPPYYGNHELWHLVRLSTSAPQAADVAASEDDDDLVGWLSGSVLIGQFASGLCVRV
ncbi:unnamed protein product [Phytophthora fragariaefolia]|uniref:Unnamed protein product n=1 Tax=Phytophthora fragariaefolia TaxID=1490495 RepID=A0A9W6UF82_9STRA|nr:unnamed protein product [Phytophthora fragariaefolia]